MSKVNEFRCYSPFYDRTITRVSMADANGSEFFVIVPLDGGKAYRNARKRAIEAISAAIETRQEPGEVRVS